MYKNAEEYLSNKSIPYRIASEGKEVQIQCLFCEDKKNHLYIKNSDGCYICHRCGVKGSWKNLIENLGDTSLPRLESHRDDNGTKYTVELDTQTFDSELAEKYHKELPNRIREYLKSDKRGLADKTIDDFKIGWDGKSIIIPVFDKKGNLTNLRHRRDPDKTKGQKFWNEKGGKAALFNISALDDKPEFVIICEGEFDVIVATQSGFPAVSSTSGAGTFKEDWVKEFRAVKTVYVCYDTDKAGKEGARKVAELFGERARIIELPQTGEKKVDLTDYFSLHKKSVKDFQKLLDNAKSPHLANESFEVIDTSELKTILHPALDFHNNKLFISLPLPIRVAGSESVKLVVMSSSREKGVVVKKTVKIGTFKFDLRGVAKVAGDKPRWDPKSVQGFLGGNSKVSSVLPFIEVKEALQRFVDFRQEKDADILALWLMGTYCFPIFDAYPYLYFVGVKRSGKTKTLLLIEKLAFNAILSSNISPAVLFRLVEAKRCTLALDEGEQLFDKTRKQELRELLNAGYKRGAPTYRSKKSKSGSFELEMFEVYSPKAIANISGLDDVLEDRAITVIMIRTKNPEKGNLAVTDSSEDWSYLRHLLYSFALDYAGQISNSYNNNPEVNALLNRQNELWRPLLSIADVIEQGFPGFFKSIKEEAFRRAEESTNIDLEDFDTAVILALRDLAPEKGEIALTNKEIKQKAHEFLEEDQREYLKSRGIGAALKRFGIKGKKVGGFWRYSTNPKSVRDLLSRYGLDVV